jgi:hypothetical protein
MPAASAIAATTTATTTESTSAAAGYATEAFETAKLGLFSCMQQNALQNQAQMSALHQNVTQLQQLEQQVLAPDYQVLYGSYTSCQRSPSSRGKQECALSPRRT